MYNDGNLVQSNTGVIAYPSAALRAYTGLIVGNDMSGPQQCKGQMEELETFNYPLSAQEIQQAAPSITVREFVLYIENFVILPFLNPTSTIAVSDPDSLNFDGGTLTVDWVANGTTDDRLGIHDSLTGGTTLSGSTVRFEGVDIGTFTGGIGLTPLVITFNANCTPAIAGNVANVLVYENVSDNPSTTPKTLRFVLTDEDASASRRLHRHGAGRRVAGGDAFQRRQNPEPEVLAVPRPPVQRRAGD